MAGRKKPMTMESAIAILRVCGWKVNVEEVGKAIVLQDSSPAVNRLAPATPAFESSISTRVTALTYV